MIRLTIIIAFYLLAAVCSASATITKNVDDLNRVNQQIKIDSANPQSSLVIFDIDDTLLESVNFVGSGKWYDWQRGRVAKDPKGHSFSIEKKDQFHCMFRTLGTLFEIASTKLTQKNAVDIINQTKPLDFMILTARTAKFRTATERELKRNGINLADRHLMPEGTSLDFIFDDERRKDQVTYKNGIVMSSGLNKGKVLKTVLQKIGKNYQRIYFIDDSLKNLRDMQNEWKKRTEDMVTFHYTKVDKTISQQEIQQSISAKLQFDAFLQAAYPDRFEEFKNGQCE